MTATPDGTGSPSAHRQVRRRRSARREQGPPQVQPTSGESALLPNPSASRGRHAAAAPESPVEQVQPTNQPTDPRPAAAGLPVEAAAPNKVGNKRVGRKARQRHRAEKASTDAVAGGQRPPATSEKPRPTDDIESTTISPPKRRSRVRDRPHPGPDTGSIGMPAPPSTDRPSSYRDRRAEMSERALRGLVSTRSTQVSWANSIRARDYAAPSPEDLAAAADDLVVVQRHYTPAEPLQGKVRGRPSQPQGRSTNKRGG